MKHPKTSSTEKRNPVGMSPGRLRVVTGYIEAHLHEKVSLRRMAELARMSPYHLGHLFKLSTGLSPHQYVLERRIMKAKELLADNRLAITEISKRLGFSSRAHFTTAFRKRVGTTPREYRLQQVEPAEGSSLDTVACIASVLI
jgi:AraC family transcriptional regulator